MSKLSVQERASLYASKCPAAVAGSGGHNATFTVACALIKGFDLTIDEARPILQEFNARCSPPWSDAEIEHKLRQADGVRDERPRGYLRDADGPTRDDSAGVERPASRAPSAPLPQPPPAKPTFQAEALRKFARRWRDVVDTLWLAERSPIMPLGVTADGFLRALFREGEKVVVFTNQRSQGQAMWPLQTIPTGGDDGVWYLAQPVDGREHPNPRAQPNEDGSPKMSRRSAESVTSWRHVVLESDEADARDWIGALVQLPMPTVAIYTSGGRSIHALVRIDAPTEQEWNHLVGQIKPVLVTLGADPKALSAVRLTRLPGCRRGNRLQKLLWLNPEADARPLCGLPIANDARERLQSWISWLEPILQYHPSTVAGMGGSDDLAECRTWLEWFAQNAAARQALARLKDWEGGDE